MVIMQNSIAVIQPTLFEGGPGGGAAYDSFATNTPLIVSDIAVNLELKDDYPEILYFKAKSSNDLAQEMTLSLEIQKKHKGYDILLKESTKRLIALRQTLIKAIKNTIEGD